MIHTLDLSRHFLLFILLVAALYTDLAQGRVDNALVYGALAAGLLIHTLAFGWGRGVADCLRDPGALGLLNALLGAGVSFALFLPFCLKGGFGAGELKLMTAVGALAGLRTALAALILTSAVGAVMALGVLALRGRLGEGLKESLGILRRLGRPSPVPQSAALTSFRYVPAIAAGTTWAWYLQHAR